MRRAAAVTLHPPPLIPERIRKMRPASPSRAREPAEQLTAKRPDNGVIPAATLSANAVTGNTELVGGGETLAAARGLEAAGKAPRRERANCVDLRKARRCVKTASSGQKA